VTTPQDKAADTRFLNKIRTYMYPDGGHRSAPERDGVLHDSDIDLHDRKARELYEAFAPMTADEKAGWLKRAFPEHNTKGPSVTHWHVRRHAEDDDELTIETIFGALDYASTELERIADHEHEGIAACGESGEFEEAYRCFVRANEFGNLQLNAHVIATQWSLAPAERAPHYQSDDGPARLLTGALHQVSEINSNGPEGFAIYECPIDECAPVDEGEPVELINVAWVEATGRWLIHARESETHDWDHFEGSPEELDTLLSLAHDRVMGG
jgi:hypothetical protein